MKLLLYCTKSKPYLRDYRGKAIYNRFVISPSDRPFTSDDTQPILNGKIVAECDFEVEEHNETTNDWLCMSLREKIAFGNMCEKANIDELECYEYANGKPLYAIHIKNLHIFDKPKELSEYITKQCQFGKCSTCKYGKNNIICSTIDTPITKAPQNMMYVYDNGVKKILISIQPQWMCLILNRIKDVEARRVVLKEMLK